MKIKVYSSPQCPWCEATKNFLRLHNINFEDIDVSADDKIIDELIKKTGRMEIPVTEIDGHIVIGFNKHLLEKFLGLEENV